MRGTLGAKPPISALMSPTLTAYSLCWCRVLGGAGGHLGLGSLHEYEVLVARGIPSLTADGRMRPQVVVLAG